jgi:hypothetical protein
MGGGLCFASSRYAGTIHRPCIAYTAHASGLATGPVHAASRRACSNGHATERGVNSCLLGFAFAFAFAYNAYFTRLYNGLHMVSQLQNELNG